MTPKEKAVELFDKYNRFDFNTIVNSTQRNYAKQCALIAVDEIINSVDEEHVSDIFNEFWNEVKQEIQAL